MSKKEHEFKADDFAVLEENKDDFKQSRIERSNIKSTFSIAEIEEHQQDLAKMHDEMEGQAKIAKATIDNIDRNHEWITKLSDEELHHAWMYKENKDVHKQASQKLEQVEEQQKVYDDLLSLLYEKFGFVETTPDVAETDDVTEEQDTKK